MNATLDQELHEQLERLSPNQQREVVDFAHFLASREKRLGVPGTELLKFAGTISDEDAAEMMQAIEEGCEQIDPDDWK